MSALHPLRNPVAAVALVLLIANDHVFKTAYGTALTGKLSDIAGVVLLPMLVVAAACFVGLRVSRRVIDSVVVASAVGFALINILPLGAALYERLHEALPLGSFSHTLDVTDLLAIPVLWLPRHVLVRRILSANQLVAR